MDCMRERVLRVDRVHHQLQLALTRDVAIDRSLPGVELLREPAHGQRLETVAVRHVDRRVHDPVHFPPRST